MSGQLSLGIEVVIDPRAGDEATLGRIVGIVREFGGEDDFWEDHVVTSEIADRLDIELPKAATYLAELRARGVLLSHTASMDWHPPDGSSTAWYIDESPRPRRAPRRVAKGILPLRMAAKGILPLRKANS
jgi:hypothetical protein